MDISNTKITHGLLVENFKQSLVNIISQNPLDIQSKALVLDYVNLQIQKLSEQQTQKELDEYNTEQAKLNEESEKSKENNNKGVSE